MMSCFAWDLASKPLGGLRTLISGVSGRLGCGDGFRIAREVVAEVSIPVIIARTIIIPN